MNTALVTGGIIAVPTIIPSCAKGANDKITLGMIGTGEHGILWNMKHFFDVPDCRIVAVCDVDKSRMLKAKHTVDETMGDHSCKTYSDFRWCSDYSVGSIAYWGAHLIDKAQWCNCTERWGPVEVEGMGSTPAEGYYNTFNRYTLKYRYENGLEMDVHGESIEICIEGTNGWLLVEGWDNPLQASDSELLKLNLSQDKIQLYTAKTEQANFIECIKSRKEPYHPAEDMHRTATIAHMGVIAMKLKRKLQ